MFNMFASLRAQPSCPTVSWHRRNCRANEFASKLLNTIDIQGIRFLTLRPKSEEFGMSDGIRRSCRASKTGSKMQNLEKNSESLCGVPGKSLETLFLVIDG